jgi:ketosteroid isomerase-like protein
MKIKFFLVLLVMVGCTSTPKEQPATTFPAVATAGFTSADSIAVVAVVKDFFKAFDEKDIPKMSGILGPAIKIIHHNGATTNREEMLAIIKETKNWWPRTRTLSNFECIADAGIAIVGCDNEVIFSLPENKKVEERYKETWIFRKTAGLWKPVRCHYSKIVVEKHTEEVN